MAEVRQKPRTRENPEQSDGAKRAKRGSSRVGAGWMADVVGGDGVMSVVRDGAASAAAPAKANGFVRDANLSALIREELPVSDDAAAPLLRGDALDVRAASQELVIAEPDPPRPDPLREEREPETPMDLEEVEVMPGEDPLALFVPPESLRQQSSLSPLAAPAAAAPRSRPLSDWAVLAAVAVLGFVLGAVLI